MENVDFLKDTTTSKKKHDIPLDHLDFKYVEKCGDVKELEKIYRVLISGVEGKYPDLENFVFEKIKKLDPNSRALRKDLPIFTKSALSKNEQALLDSEIENFVKEIPSLEKNILTTSKPDFNDEDDKNLPPVRSAKQKVLINSTKTDKPMVQESKPSTNGTSSKKSVKPKDYREWEKIEKNLENELNDKDEEKENSKNAKTAKNETLKVKEDKTVVNSGNNLSKSLLKDLKKDVKVDGLDETTRTLKADQEKCKGNEAYGAGCYQEALTYYTRSIKYIPNAASFNNRALTYIKLEEWDKAIEDCNEVLKYEKDNIKALLRRATALFKKKNYDKAKTDIDKCLKLDPNDKKAQELNMQIEKESKKDKEEKEKVKSIGGNRLKIEETDGSDEESEEEYTQTNPVNKQASQPIDNQKKQITIAEVESDESESSDDDDSETIEIKKQEEPKEPEKISETINSSNVESHSAPIIAEQAENKTEKIKPERKLELPSNVIEPKDKGNNLFSSGQYGEAIDYYSKAIENLKSFASNSTDEDKTEIDNFMSVLYNNRASCSQHICDYKNCISDCNFGLDLLADNQNEQLKLKLLFKKANALEMIEKYEEAFVTYETLMKLDSKFKNVQINYNRVKNILSSSGKLNKIRSNAQATEKKDQTSTSTKAEVSNKQNSAENVAKLYEDYKNKGNDFVKQSDYEKACEYYTKCIDLDNLNPLAYANRSLCYIKMNQPNLAIKDATFVLEKDSKNVKAIYRRALAYKLKEDYNLALKDIENLLLIEPNNQIARNELIIVENFIRNKQETKKVEKKDTSAEFENKKIVNDTVKSDTKKVLIKEVDTENTNEKSSVKHQTNIEKEEKNQNQRNLCQYSTQLLHYLKRFKILHQFQMVMNFYKLGIL